MCERSGRSLPSRLPRSYSGRSCRTWSRARSAERRCWRPTGSVTRRNAPSAITSWLSIRARSSRRPWACCSGTSSRDRRRRGRSRAAPTQADRLRTNGANTQNRRMQVQHTQGRQQRSMTRRSPTRVGQRRWMSEEPQPGHETVIARGVLSVRGPGSEGRASTTKPSTTAGQQREGGQRQSLCGVSFRGPRRRTRWRCVPLAVRWRARFQDDRRRRSVRP